MERSVVDRIFYEKNPDWQLVHEARPGSFQNVCARFRGIFLSRVVRSTIPLTRAEYLARFRGDRRFRLYERFLDPLHSRRVTAKDATVSTFVKREKTFLLFDTRFGGKADPVPRPIQPRKPRYRFELGRFIVPIEKELFRGINRVFRHTAVAKGLDLAARAAVLREHWLHFRNPVALKVDAHRFDAHIRESALRYEHSFYVSMIGENDRDELAKLLQWQLKYRIKGLCRQGKFVATGRVRGTGDPNTGCGNTLLACSMWWSFFDEMQVGFRYLGDGDDGIIILESEHAPAIMAAIPRWFSTLGMVMTVLGPERIFERILFCGCRPVLTSAGYLMVRDFWPAIAKDSHCCADLTLLPLREWLWAVGSCGLAIAGGIPVFQVLYQQYLSWGKPTDIHKLKNTERGLYFFATDMRQQRAVMPISEEVRASFWKAFLVPPTQQVALENYYADLSFVEEYTSTKVSPTDVAYLLDTYTAPYGRM